MKKLLNISLLLLVFCASGSLSCRSITRSKQQKTKAAEPGLSASDFFSAQTRRTATTQGQPIPAPTTIRPAAQSLGIQSLSAGSPRSPITRSPIARSPIQRPIVQSPIARIPAPTGLVDVSAPGSSVISRTYPWPECGVVQMDKVMPNEVGLNRSFNYTIKITNLTETVRQLRSAKGPAMLEIMVQKGARTDLGRPKTSPIENKTAFIEFLSH